MNCPRCQATTTVFNSRTPIGGGHVYRRRRCLGCNERFTTYEQFIDELPGIRTTCDGRVDSNSLGEAPEILDLLGHLGAADRAIIMQIARRLADADEQADARAA